MKWWKPQSESPGGPGAPPETTLRYVSLMLVFATIVGLGAMAYVTERSISVSRDWVVHTYQVRSQLSQLQLEVMRAQTNESTYLLLHDRNQALASGEQSALAGQTVEMLRLLTKDNPRQQRRLQELGQMLNDNAALIHTQSNAAAEQVQLSPAETTRQSDINDHRQQIEALVHQMQDEEEILLEQRLHAWDYLFRRNVFLLGLALAVVALMMGYNFRILMGEVARTKEMERQGRAKAESYRLMSARILEMQDLERRRIARGLHDSVGQYLAGLKISLSQLESRSRADLSIAVSETMDMTDQALQEVRTISHLLHPPLLDELGFLPAARWYLDEYGKRGHVKVSLEIEEPIDPLSKDLEIALFRVLQESLTNVYRHAAAQNVCVRMSCRDGYVMLHVKDDGKGIPQEVLNKFRAGVAPGIGLAGMRERLAELGGKIDVKSSSAGTTLEASIPTADRQSAIDVLAQA